MSLSMHNDLIIYFPYNAEKNKTSRQGGGVYLFIHAGIKVKPCW